MCHRPAHPKSVAHAFAQPDAVGQHEVGAEIDIKTDHIDTEKTGTAGGMQQLKRYFEALGQPPPYGAAESE